MCITHTVTGIETPRVEKSGKAILIFSSQNWTDTLGKCLKRIDVDYCAQVCVCLGEAFSSCENILCTFFALNVCWILSSSALALRLLYNSTRLKHPLMRRRALQENQKSKHTDGTQIEIYTHTHTWGRETDRERHRHTLTLAHCSASTAVSQRAI